MSGSSGLDAQRFVDTLNEVQPESVILVPELAKVLVHRSLTADLTRHLADEAMAIELSSRSDDFAEFSRSRREQRDPDYTGR
jgi:hypothetical protein